MARRASSVNSGGRSRLVAAVLALGAPLLVGAALALWALAESPLESARATQPLRGTVERTERRDREHASATFIAGRPLSVVTQSSGTVTALAISPGEAIVPGAEVMSVDGRSVVAYLAPSPLYRDITAGLRGDDVAIAQQLLVDMGLLNEVNGRAGKKTMSAIRAFNSTHGYGAEANALAVGSLLWVPQGSPPPRTVTINIGLVIQPQTELYVTSSGEDRIDVDTMASAVDRVLTVETVTAQLVAGQVAVTDPAEVAAIKAVLGDKTVLSATLEPVQARDVGTVPSSAVVVDPGGRACFFADVTGPGTQIDVENGSFGLVDVDPGLVGSQVLINPRETREDLTCGS